MRAFSLCAAAFGLGLTLAGCVTDGDRVDVQVAATSAPGTHLSRGERLCFSDKLPLKTSKEQQQELIRICSEVARSKGLDVVNLSAKADCLLTVATADATSLQLQFFTGIAASPVKAHTIKVTTLDEAPSDDVSGRGIQTAMCRAAFQDFPATLHAKTYAAKVATPKATDTNQLASESCQESPTNFWQIPRLRCTRPGGEVCIREYDREATAADCTRQR